MIRPVCLLLLALPFASCATPPSASQPSKPAQVSTGLVEWHAGGLEAAKQASAVSGKPVLLFELFGNLDEVFC